MQTLTCLPDILNYEKLRQSYKITHLLKQLRIYDCTQQAAVCFAQKTQRNKYFASHQIRLLQKVDQALYKLLLLVLHADATGASVNTYSTNIVHSPLRPSI